ncbi:DNAJC3 (predicted), partial [Pycnogonum litorale]
ISRTNVSLILVILPHSCVSHFTMAKYPSIYRFCSHFWVFFLSMDFNLDVAETSVASEIEQHLEMGKQLLAKRQYSDALSHFHAAVEKDPSNYLTYFKRATVYLALGKSKSALDDLNAVLKLKPDFLGARITRGEILLKQARLDEAHIDFEKTLQVDPGNSAVLSMYSSIETLRHDIQLAHDLINGRRHHEAVDVLNKVMQIAPWNVDLHEMRADCYIVLGDLIKAISDLRPTTKLRPDNTKAYLRLSKLHYQLGEADESLTQIRECLKLDPDHKECHPHYKKVKKLAKQLIALNEYSTQEKYEECIEKAYAVLKIESQEFNFVRQAKSKLCHCNNKAGQAKEAIEICTETLNMVQDDVNVLCDRAESYIGEEMFNEALQDYQAASQYDENSRRAQEGIKKVQKLIKQSKRRDYYKILGVK